MNINTSRIQKHHIDILFLMILFLIFTFSAVSVLLLAVNSYRSVVDANHRGTDARAAMSYVREVVHSTDEADAISVGDLEGCEALVINESEGYSRYIYQYDGYLMELVAKEDSGATPEFGDKIIEAKSFDIAWKETGKLLEVEIIDASGDDHMVEIGVYSQSTVALKENVDNEAAKDQEVLKSEE
ncbi:MAG: DUF4860 domain-containing protein [Pseudobutyrivibrio sp.]|nr:DUF4860 domain-containing protein [Pseudobutyrivibrio sp.]